MAKLDDIKKACKSLIDEGKVKYIIGYKKRNSHYNSIPAFISNSNEIDQLTWDPTCLYNLARFLRDEKIRREMLEDKDTRPVGIIVKGCDSRTINVLLQEKYIERKDLYIIGIACENAGVVDERKVQKKFGVNGIEEIMLGENNSFIVTATKKNTKVPIEELLAERCIDCINNTPLIYDVLLGEDIRRVVLQPFKSIDKIESLSTEEKWDFWKKELDKCIRCYACRSICPMCYCDECVADSINLAVKPDTTAEEKAQKIRWIEKSPVTSENFNYHLIRAIHMAGRCTDCGECERVCPVDIPLRHLNRKMEKEAKEKFDYMAGMGSEEPAMFTCFKDNDPQDFIR